MTGHVPPAVQLTINDIEVGVRLAEALVQQARTTQGAAIAHADLLTLARGLHPRDAVLGRAVPIGIGAKLQFVSSFCTSHGYPDLACLAADGPDRQDGRRAVAAFDWAPALAQLDAYAANARGAVPARLKPRKERPADVAWYAYFCSHRDACKWIGPEDKQEIVNLVMAGLDPDTAMKRVQAARAALNG